MLPRRAVYHKIEFEPGAKPPTLAGLLWLMAPPELVELRKQLKEVILARYIKASDGTIWSPVLFQKKREPLILH